MCTVLYLQMNNEYLKGMLDAKLSKLLQESDYNVFASFDEEKQVEYLVNLNITNKLTAQDFEAVCLQANAALAHEVSDYVGANHPIFKYFFSSSLQTYEQFQKARQLNDIYDGISETLFPYLFKFMNIKQLLTNLLTIYRLKALKQPRETFKQYLLKQAIVNEEILLNLFNQDIEIINTFVKQEVGIEIKDNATLSELEALFDHYLYEAIQEYAYAPSLEATLVYYVFMKKQEIYRLRKIHYTGGLN